MNSRIVLIPSMTLPRRLRLFVFFLLFFGVGTAFADDINKISPTGYITDLAGVIPSATQQRLESLCAELQQKTGAQLAIVTVRSLDDRPVEDYAVDLFKHLAVGFKKESNGVLLLLAPNDRKYRIEVGYGLEPIINDARAGDAGRAMVPFLRQNDYGSAVEIAAWQLAKYIADDKGVTLSGQPPVRRAVNNRPGNIATERGSPFGLIVGFFLIVFFFSQVFRAASAAGRGSGCSNGCLWLLPFLLSAGGGYRGGSSGDSWGGGGFGGGSSGGGGDFGGFGGGSSGGGGASGSW
jgi:uncharacterized protein